MREVGEGEGQDRRNPKGRVEGEWCSVVDPIKVSNQVLKAVLGE